MQQKQHLPFEAAKAGPGAFEEEEEAGDEVFFPGGNEEEVRALLGDGDDAGDAMIDADAEAGAGESLYDFWKVRDAKAKGAKGVTILVCNICLFQPFVRQRY